MTAERGFEGDLDGFFDRVGGVEAAAPDDADARAGGSFHLRGPRLGRSWAMRASSFLRSIGLCMNRVFGSSGRMAATSSRVCAEMKMTGMSLVARSRWSTR